MSGASRRAAAGALALLVAAWAGASLYDRPPATPGAWLVTARLEPRYAELGPERVRYVRAGHGPTVVLLHGFASSLYTWKDVIPALAARHDVIALDLPGFGGSSRPARLSFADLPRATLALLDALGVERAALVGNSLGGAAAASVAAAEPRRVTRLGLLDAAILPIPPQERPLGVRLAGSPLAPLLQWLPGKRLVVEHALGEVFHDDSLVTPERVAEYLAPLERPGSFAAMRSLVASFDGAAARAPEAALARIEAPTLVIWGADDRWIPPSHAERLAAAIAGARQRVIPDCGHVPEEEKPAEVARLLLELLG